MPNFSKEERRRLAIENASYPKHCISVPVQKWSFNMPENLLECWRSRDFLAQIYDWRDGARRMTICRTEARNGNWVQGITWDDLQRLKGECGYKDWWAVEIFPAEMDVVNVANMRHLWILRQAPEFAWKRVQATGDSMGNLLRSKGAPAAAE